MRRLFETRRQMSGFTTTDLAPFALYCIAFTALSQLTNPCARFPSITVACSLLSVLCRLDLPGSGAADTNFESISRRSLRSLCIFSLHPSNKTKAIKDSVGFNLRRAFGAMQTRALSPRYGETWKSPRIFSLSDCTGHCFLWSSVKK